MRKRRKRTFEVTTGQILAGLIIAALALTIAFEVGVSVGKKRVINAEREVMRQDNIRMRAATEAPTEEDLPSKSSPDQPTEPSEVEKAEPGSARQGGIQIPAAMKASTGGDLLQRLPTERLKVGEKELPYTAQVATFRSRQNAENLVEKLESYEYESWLKPEPYAKEMFFSVFAGRFGTRDEAEQFGRSMQERLSYITHYRVRKIQE